MSAADGRRFESIRVTLLLLLLIATEAGSRSRCKWRVGRREAWRAAGSRSRTAAAEGLAVFQAPQAWAAAAACHASASDGAVPSARGAACHACCQGRQSERYGAGAGRRMMRRR